MWVLDYKESWAPKNWCFWTVALEKSLESPLDGKEIKPVDPKGNQSWIFIGRTDAEAETLLLWPSDAKNWLIGKDPDAGKDWRQEKGMTENEMVGWHHRLNGHEFEQALGVGDGQEGLVCCSPWGHDWATALNWTENIFSSEYSHNYHLVQEDENFQLLETCFCIILSNRSPFLPCKDRTGQSCSVVSDSLRPHGL